MDLLLLKCLRLLYRPALQAQQGRPDQQGRPAQPDLLDRPVLQVVQAQQDLPDLRVQFPHLRFGRHRHSIRQVMLFFTKGELT